ncbi:UV DNA damage repair endonuclease UvsE [Chloroflexota bacterium]
MRIGYPCINRTLGCKGSRTFRLKSYSEERLVSTVRNNLDCLLNMLRFNVEHDILFFRITSDLVPFASHPVCDFDWLEYFDLDFKAIGKFIIAQNIRISMHPGQFTVLNSPQEGVMESSIKELEYHTQVLDAMGLDRSAKIQLHIGGVYGSKEKGMTRFMERYHALDSRIKRRLIIENDERNYSLADCLQIHSHTRVPILFDSLHHELNNTGETVEEVFTLLVPTWSQEDGLAMIDYSSSRTSAQRLRHTESIDLQHFTQFITRTRPHDCDIMLEIKDKEKSALKAVEMLRSDDRFNNLPEEISSEYAPGL